MTVNVVEPVPSTTVSPSAMIVADFPSSSTISPPVSKFKLVICESAVITHLDVLSIVTVIGVSLAAVFTSFAVISVSPL